VVIPVYDGAETIAACVASVLGVEYPRERFEVVVVDNGSTDGTLEVLHAFGADVRVLSESTRGASAARNRGIRESCRPVIVLTDADCMVEPGWLASLVAPLADEQVGVVGGRILSRRSGNRIERFGEQIHDHRRAIEEQDPPYAITMNWASRRAVLLEAGLFDESLLRAQDVDLSWRIGRLGYRLVYAHDAVVRHHNERTIRGLVREGYVHGLHAVRLREKHAAYRAGAGSRRNWLVRQLGRDLRGSLKGSTGLLNLLFDSGKAVGDIVGRFREGRRV
jgi:glycosyltransferase involved in cell wall biosynthesis